MEWRVLPRAWWRVGYRTDTVAEQSQLAGFTTGVGLQVWEHELAYAWVPLGELGSTQYLSLVFRFGPPVAEKRRLIEYQRIKKHKTATGPAEGRLSESEELMQLLNEDNTPHPKDAEAPRRSGWK